MPRVAGVNLPQKKQIKIALTYIYGIGDSLSKKILEQANLDKETKVKNLSSNEINRLTEIISKNYTVEGELRRKKKDNIKRLKDIDCWRGIRHKKGLPVRGQRTQSNSRTVRGNVRKTVGSVQKKAPSPK
ncbi:MAG: 30S ribosomal protein S13 [Minisyncoccales bacterium]